MKPRGEKYRDDGKAALAMERGTVSRHRAVENCVERQMTHPTTYSNL